MRFKVGSSETCSNKKTIEEMTDDEVSLVVSLQVSSLAKRISTIRNIVDLRKDNLYKSKENIQRTLEVLTELGDELKQKVSDVPIETIW